jgi:hypothetical protein
MSTASIFADLERQSLELKTLALKTPESTKRAILLLESGCTLSEALAGMKELDRE